LCFDERRLSEYRDVLTRGKFGFEPALIDELLDFIEATGVPGLAEPLDLHLPDPTDGMFIEVCLAAGANYLITGNARHFPAR
jgi:predicted nucleic acid-binding protein